MRSQIRGKNFLRFFAREFRENGLHPQISGRKGRGNFWGFFNFWLKNVTVFWFFEKKSKMSLSFKHYRKTRVFLEKQHHFSKNRASFSKSAEKCPTRALFGFEKCLLAFFETFRKMTKVGHFAKTAKKPQSTPKKTPPVASSFWPKSNSTKSRIRLEKVKFDFESKFDLDSSNLTKVKIWLQVKFDFEAKFDLDSSNFDESQI